MTALDWLFELFNYKIKKFLAVDYLRVTYFLSIVSICSSLGIYEYGIARPVDSSISLKVGLGLAGLIGGIIAILIVRIITEFLVAIFYIEEHLSQISKSDRLPLR